MSSPLIIFDCDGVLVDSEAIANDAMAEVFAGLGLSLSGVECRRMFQGKMMEDVCREAEQLAGIARDPQLPARVRQVTEEALAGRVGPVPGVVELVHSLVADEIEFCVASSGSVSKMQLTLGGVGLLPVMRGRLFSAQDVGRGKPHPDVFLTAAAAMGRRCEEAVIIEDSVTGVQAGVASGARVLGYAGDEFTDAQALSDNGAEVFFDMAEVRDLAGL